MNVTYYWPMAREYSVWNATVAALQFWRADLKVHVLSSAIEQVYNVFFCSASAHLLCQQSDEILFGHFMTPLNAAFESRPALEDEGYESGSKNFNIPTPLRRTCKIHHISSVKNASFDPDPVTPCSTGTRQSHVKGFMIDVPLVQWVMNNSCSIDWKLFLGSSSSSNKAEEGTS